MSHFDKASVDSETVAVAVRARFKSSDHDSLCSCFGPAGMLPVQFCSEIGDALCLQLFSTCGFSTRQLKALKKVLKGMLAVDVKTIQGFPMPGQGTGKKSKGNTCRSVAL